MWRFCIMGRGRKGLIEQSKRKTKSSRGQSEIGTPMTHFFVPNREAKKIFLPEEAFEFMKNMNPQHLVDFSFAKRRLVRQDFRRQCFWKLIKYSTCKFKFVYTSVKSKNISCITSHFIFKPQFHLFLPLPSPL